MVSGFGRFLHRLQGFILRKQRCGMYRFARTTGGERNGDRRSADLVGHFGNDDYIVLAERHESGDDLSSQFLDGLSDHFHTILRLRDQPDFQLSPV